MSIVVPARTRASSNLKRAAFKETHPAVGVNPTSHDMDEDRAAALGNPWPGIVIELDDEVIEPVFAAEAVARVAGRQPDRPIVAPVARVLAPGVSGADGAGRQ